MRSYNPTVASALVYPTTPAVQQMQRVVGTSVVLFADHTFPSASTGLQFHVREVGSYDAIGLRWHDDLYRRVFGVAHPFEEATPKCLNRLKLFGVQWVIGGSGVLADETGGLPRSGSLGVVPYYAVPDSSFAHLVGKSRSAPGDRRAIQYVTHCAFDPDELVTIGRSSYDARDDAPLGRVRGTSVTHGQVRVLASQGQNVSLKTSSSSAAWLVLHQSWAPGWKATIDGEPATVRRADVAFQAVRVPPGAHMVHLSYEPNSVASGAFISVASLVILAGLLGFAGLGRRRRVLVHAREQPSRQPEQR